MDKNEFARQVLDAETTLYRISKSILKSDSECADAVQEALIIALRNVHTLKEPRYFKTWLCRILIHECYKIHRMNKRVVPFSQYTPPESAMSLSENAELYEAILTLESGLRLCVVLYYIEGFSIAEVSGILKIPEGTVKSRLSRARVALKAALSDEEVVRYGTR